MIDDLIKYFEQHFYGEHLKVRVTLPKELSTMAFEFMGNSGCMSDMKVYPDRIAITMDKKFIDYGKAILESSFLFTE